MIDWKKEYAEAFFQMLECVHEEKEKYDDICCNLVFENFPTSLFKYSYFDRDEHWKELVLGEVFFQHPSSWNDLFDSACVFEYERLKKEMEEICLRMNISDFENKTQNLVEEVIKWTREAVLEKNRDENKSNKPSEANGMENTAFHEFIKKLNFCSHFTHVFKASCFSEENNNMKMWYYYAANYTGFCVEFDFSEHKHAYTQYMRPVMYTEKKYIAQEADYFVGKKIFLPMLLKNPCWSNEKEWRFIYPHNPTFEVQALNEGIVKGIYLGNKISQDDEEQVISHLKNSKNPIPKIFKMVPNKYINSFDAQEISI